jgi:nucleotide-binding universal stress UspA family protein
MKSKRTKVQSHPREFRRLIVPIDFSVQSESSCTLAVQLARRWNAKLLLLHVIPSMVGGHFLSNNRLQSRMADQLAEFQEKWVPSGIATTRLVITGSPFNQIINEAGKPGDLIVIATHGRTGFKHLFLGSTAERVIRHARCPVLVNRAFRGKRLAKHSWFSRILVPIDFSNHSRASLRFAIGLAESFDARLFLTHVVEPPMYPREGFAELRDEVGMMKKVAARSMEHLLKARGFDRKIVETSSIRTGDAHQEILKEAEGRKADLIVMATHGYTGFTHVLMGSVCEKVIRHAGSSVLVLPSTKK